MVHKKVPIIIQRKEERIVSILKITRLSFFFFINLGRQTGSEISEKLEKEEVLLFCSFPSWPVCHLGWSAGWLPIWMVKKQTQYKSSPNIWYVMRQNNCSDTETREIRKGRERVVLLFCYFAVLPFCCFAVFLFCCFATGFAALSILAGRQVGSRATRRSQNLNPRQIKLRAKK